MTGRGGGGGGGQLLKNFLSFENGFHFLLILSSDQILERTVLYSQNPNSKTFFLLISKKIKSV